MPETIRTAHERLRSRPRRGGFLVSFVAAIFCIALNAPAGAGVTDWFGLFGAASNANRQDVVGLTLTIGLVCFAVLATVVLLRTRKHAEHMENVARDEAMSLRAETDRLKTLLLSEPQVLVAWAAAADRPEILGDTAIVAPGHGQERVLAFGSWLEAAAAQRMQHAVDALREQGRGFVMTLTTSAGRPIEAEGSAVGGRAVLRLRDVSGIERELIDLATRHDALLADVETMRALLDTLPAPVWAREQGGRLIFVNSAYARAVEVADANEAVAREAELLDSAGRDELARARAAGKPYAGRLPAIVAGERRSFDVVDAPNGHGSAGIAIDRTEVETMRAGLARTIEAHRRVLDQLATGVVIFAEDRKLTFYNAAFRSLFELDAGFLDQTPSDNAVLDRLRADRKLPEEQDFRQWRNQLHEAYRAVEPKEHLWHLPGGRTLRVVTTPNPEGGITYLYDDVTERLDMVRRYDALIKVQSETWTISPKQSRCSARTAACACTIPPSPACGSCNPTRSTRARMWRRSPPGARRCTTTTPCGARCALPSPRSTTANRWPRASSGATAW